MSPVLLSAANLWKSYDGVHALADFSVDIEAGEIVGLIGPNGAGKTTLFNVLTGFTSPNAGRATLGGANLIGRRPWTIARRGVARTFQNLRLIRSISTAHNVMLSFRDNSGEKLGNVFFRWRACRNWDRQNMSRALKLMGDFGLRDMAEVPAGALSYGQQKLLSVLCCLASDADLLLLDEPIAGIAPEMTESILAVVRELPSRGKTVILIEHNMTAIWNLCTRVVFMDAGKKVSEGPPNHVREDPRVINAYLR
jgi:ABC-type branched-subunit amino acid transport system ATPase component